ncbi:hypothetical protein HOY82DRAFT_581497 [Tuber indicum]|nr:hypothetical protein HOY82DRAFT_581497 [Tuber indicum]
MATDVSRHPATGSNTSSGNSKEHHQHKGRKPFSALMKRLANLKGSNSNHNANSNPSPTIRIGSGQRSASCPSAPPNYPYSSKPPKDTLPPPSSSSSAVESSHLSFAVAQGFQEPSHSLSSTNSNHSSPHHSPTHPPSDKSHPAPSNTTATTSAFSSPTPSVRSLTTTLTTIQSTAPGSLLHTNYNPHPHHHHNPHGPPVLFQHQFPSTPSANGPPTSPSPIAHLNGSSLHPLNYNTATANNLLTDNASIITLASSSKRRRRHSLDTDASVRALAPSSLWGGSRESLPLSVLSGNLDVGRSVAGERGSLYGSTSFASRGGDAGSMRDYGSGSIMGEISGTPGNNGTTAAATGSPLGNRESLQLGRTSRRSSGWGAETINPGDDCDDDDGRSLSARSASLRVDGETFDAISMKDGSSNVGVWHGVFGKVEGRGENGVGNEGDKGSKEGKQ